MKKKIIGITGNIGSGKSLVASLLRDYGYPVFDADELNKEAVLQEDVKKEVVLLFGKEAYTSEGVYHRAYIRNEILKNPSKKVQLERLLHPEIQKLFEEEVKKITACYSNAWIFYEASLIIEAQRQTSFDALILVTSPIAMRQERVLTSRNLKLEDFQRICQNQLPEEIKGRYTPFVLKNEASSRELEENLHEMLFKLKTYFKVPKD
jgi:dephospho-CoA kinase